MTDKKKELPITLDIEFTESMGISVPLCILSTVQGYRNWMNTNYMMPIACMKGDDMFEYVIADGARYGWLSQMPPALMRFSFVGDNILKDVRDIIEVLVESIDMQQYCVLFLDNYYLPCEESFQKVHYVHEVLIYGYDIGTHIFQIITYGRKIHKAEIAFNDLKNGFEAAFEYIKDTDGWDKYMLMQYSLINHKRDYPYYKKEFLGKLRLYKEGNLPEKVYFERYLYQNYEEGDCFYGLKANEAFLIKMKRVREMFSEGDDETKYDIFRQYGPIHTYVEFHKALLKRLTYYNSLCPRGIVTNKVLKKYIEIVNLIEVIRFLYIKLQIYSNQKYNEEKIIRILNAIIEKLEVIIFLETKVMNEILEI